jgi:hypothetical protein
MGACLNGKRRDLHCHSQDLLTSYAEVCCIAVVVIWSDVLCMMGCLMLTDATTPILLQCLSRFDLLEFAV